VFPGDAAKGLPMIVLIDAGIGQRLEIVAGALQDQHRALIMGERSFGKGSVQTMIPIDKDHAVKLTTARYYTPSGRSVQEGGIEPDIRVPQISDPTPPSATRTRCAKAICAAIWSTKRAWTTRSWKTTRPIRASR
jgi:carboxyl-terminal processing protease